MHFFLDNVLTVFYLVDVFEMVGLSKVNNNGMVGACLKLMGMAVRVKLPKRTLAERRGMCSCARQAGSDATPVLRPNLCF